MDLVMPSGWTALGRSHPRALMGQTMDLPATMRAPVRLRGRRDGFTMVELALVMIIMGIIASFAIPSFNNMQRSRGATNARDAFVWMSARARSRAIETGATQLLQVDPVNDRAWIVLRRQAGTPMAADTLQMINFPVEHNATLTTAGNTLFTVCYNPRGYANRCDASSPNTNVDVTFDHASKTATARVKLLGQIERL